MRESTARLIESQLDSSSVFISEDNDVSIRQPHMKGKYCYSISVWMADTNLTIGRSKEGIVFKSLRSFDPLHWTCNPPSPPGTPTGRGDNISEPESVYTLPIKSQIVADTIFHRLTLLKESKTLSRF